MAKKPIIIVLSGGKGGVGRSTLSRNFLVAAQISGHSVIGFDLDAQATLLKWATRRIKTANVESDSVTPIKVISANVDDWRDIVKQCEKYEIAIVDTAPGIESNLVSMTGLCKSASFVVIPCGVTHDDIESVVPWAETLAKNAVKSVFVLNKANRRTKSFDTARATLHKYGRLCPFEVPQLEDIHTPAADGLCAMDFENAKGTSALESVWNFVAREVGLKQ